MQGAGGCDVEKISEYLDLPCHFRSLASRTLLSVESGSSNLLLRITALSLLSGACVATAPTLPLSERLDESVYLWQGRTHVYIEQMVYKIR